MLDQVRNSHFQEVIEKVESLRDEEQKKVAPNQSTRVLAELENPL